MVSRISAVGSLVVVAVFSIVLVAASSRVWHWCIPSGQHYSFLCPNQTLFNQVYRVCDWWYNVDCSGSPDNYNINEDLYKIPDEFVGRSIDQPDPVDEEISDEA
ncbi:putative Chitin binding Peritrophin-A domain-containing protein 24 [Homarus americanus]|uniref:Putative Chitin binding Peritrophin-A domain-containing protein 24 n=1 Tax=Homarus americanus TaxID=6706 RepID=A0A8J5N282_HOMAM|nr:putative Chitin binding Peritrophin-A domain-containing protein 24 [Homarus americanus]